jgi:predicted dehydrogenase
VPWRGKWATELGGALLGHAIHAHDLLCYALGPIRSVFARTATRVNQIEVEDCAAIALEMASGALASLSVTLGSPAEISRHRFTFQNFSAESNTRPYTSSGDPWTFTGDSPELAAQIEEAMAGFEPLPEGYAGQFYRFARALDEGGELPVTLTDARASIELITALYHSAETGQPVMLPIGPDHPKYESWLPA